MSDKNTSGPDIATELEKSSVEFLAFCERIASHSVGVLTDLGAGVGTGTIITVGTKRIIVTAHHVVKGNDAKDLRFAFKSPGNLALGKVRTLPPAPIRSIEGRSLKIINEAHDTSSDLSGYLLSPDEEILPPAEPFDSSGIRATPIPDSATLIYQGFPTDNAVQVGPQTKSIGMVADRCEYSAELNSDPRLAHLLEDGKRFAVEYGWRDELKPFGFSGSGVWAGLTPSGGLWTANPALVGIVTDTVGGRVILAVKAEFVVQLISQITK